MIPIFEQGQGQGIGHTFDSFLNKFINICEQHLESGRAQAFAFIFYDFGDEHVKNILKTKGGFARLDRLSGRELSVFYLDSDNKRLFGDFNEIFLGAFNIRHRSSLPFVLFFKVADREVTDIEIVELEQSNLMFAFEELYTTIESYINNNEEQENLKTNKLTQFVNQVKRISVDKLIKWVVDKGLRHADDMF